MAFAPTSTKNLGIRLLAALNAEPHAHACVRHLLCNGDVPSTLPHAFVLWMRDFPTMRPVLGDILNVQSRPGPVVPAQMVLGPLLVWSATQPWASDINWSQVTTAWCASMDTLRVDKDVATMRCVLDAFLPIAQYLPNDKALLLCETWLDCKNLWQLWGAHRARPILLLPEMVENTLRDAALAWSHVGELAVAIGGPTLDRWHKLVQGIFPKSTGAIQQEVLVTFLQSNLPAATKCRVVCSATLELLLDTNIAPLLMGHMPLNECERLDILLASTSEAPRDGYYSEYRHSVMLDSQSNKAFVQTYCPVLYDFLNATLAVDDWMNKTCIVQAARLLMPTPKTMVSMPLPNGWDSEQS